MEFDNSFEVPLDPAQAWALLIDIPRIAPCMPGAELTETVDTRHYKGKISVRLGPVALAFAGNIELFEIDDAKHAARVKAQGNDAKGRGSANATAAFRIEPSGSGSKVLIHTALMLSGAVAQYGRGVGMIQAAAAQIIGQFAANLRAQLVGAPVSAAVPAPARAPAPSPAPARVPAPSLEPAPAVPARAPAPSSEAAPPAPVRAPGPPPQPVRNKVRPAATARPPRPSNAPQRPAAAKPISGFSLLARIIWDDIVGLFKKRPG